MDLHAIPTQAEIETETFDWIHPLDKIEYLEAVLAMIEGNLQIVAADTEVTSLKEVDTWRALLPFLRDQLDHWHSMLRFAPDFWMRHKKKSKNARVFPERKGVRIRTGKSRS